MLATQRRDRAFDARDTVTIGQLAEFLAVHRFSKVDALLSHPDRKLEALLERCRRQPAREADGHDGQTCLEREIDEDPAHRLQWLPTRQGAGPFDVNHEALLCAFAAEPRDDLGQALRISTIEMRDDA